MVKLPRFLVLSCALAAALVFTNASHALAQSTPLAPQERLCDPAFQDCRADVLTYIRQETVEIDMAYWMMTDARYSNELVKAWNRGVKIRLLMDPRCVEQHSACVAQNDQLAAAGVPMRNRITSGILHWKAAIFVGQGQLEFAGANYAPYELTPADPFINYTDEIVAFSKDPSILQSFMTKFDDMWTSQTEFRDYANINGPLLRSFPTSPIDPELNFPPDEGYANRALAAYAAETQKIDVQMFRITDGRHPDAMIDAVRRGVPVRLITDETEYRNPLRYQDAYNVDRMYANGVDVRFDGHQGIDHEKAVILYGNGMSIFGSSNWTDASDDSQREHNRFTTQTWMFDWLKAQFERKWYNQTGYAETKPFVPLGPNTPSYNSPSSAATAVPTTGVSLAWDAGLWAYVYDIYFGTSPNPPLLAADRNLGPSRSSGDYRRFSLPELQPGTTYYWKIVSKTMANVTTTGPVWRFTTAGTAPGPNAPPSVTLTSPAAGADVTAPGTIALAASASDTDGTVTRVDFFAGASLVGTATSAPFTATWSNVPAGSYTITAVATDDRSASTESSAVPITVSPAGQPSISLVRGPYLQQPTDHSMVVVWATREPGPAEVRYGPGSATISVGATSRLVPSTTTSLGYDYYQHEATLAGLSSETSFVYRPYVGGAAAAPQASFTTAPAAGTGAISFVALGDSGTGSTEQRQIASLLSQENFNFLLHVGDIAYGSSAGVGDASYATYQSFLFDIYPWLATRPFVPVEGNHDSRPSNNNGRAYIDLMSLPTNGASAAWPDHAERYYSFDYGQVHFIALDTEFTFLDPARQAEQLRWLEADLQATHQPWKIAFLHRAPYSSGGEHGSSLDVRAAFGPLFERYGVDLVLAGHEHDYERTTPIRESSNPADHAVPYIVTGGGGAPLYPAGTSSWTAFSASSNEYLKVTVDACTLTTTAVGLDGNAFDSSTIRHCTAPTVALTSPAAGATFTAPATVALSATASDPDGSVAKVDFYAGSSLVGTSTSAPYGATWNNVAAGSYTLTAVVTDDGGTQATSSPVSITVTPPSGPPSNVPPGWSHADVGNTGAAGYVTYDSGTFTVGGAGADVWDSADALQYAYRPLDGDGSIVAHVASVQAVANWTKAGVMIRGSVSPSSAQAFMLVSAGKGVAFQRRRTDGASSLHTAGSASSAPRWVKLVRSGNTISGFESANGTTWTPVGSDTFVMGASVDVGLAVSSHVSGTVATAVFDSVTVSSGSGTTNTPPTVTLTSPATGTTATAPATLTFAATASDPDGTVAKVEFYAGSTLIGPSTSAPYSLTWTNVAAGTYILKAVATDNQGAASTSNTASVTVSPPSSTLPAGWTNADVGSTGAAGSSTFNAGTFTIRGAGADVWDAADAFQYAYRTLDGDGTIVAHVSSVQAVANWTKAGVMIRGSLSPSSAQAFMLVSAGKGVAFQRRRTDGASSLHTPGSASTAPRWVKLTRSGNTISGFESADGTTWTPVGSDTFVMGATVDVGLAVSSHVSGTLATALFDSVTVSPAGSPTNTPPTVSLTSPATGTTATAPATISLAADASDSDGTIAKVDFYAGSTLLGTATSAPYALTWSNVAAGTYSLTAVATDNGGAAATSNAATVTINPPASTLPAGWSSGDIGSVPIPGDASFSGGTFSVKGSGADIWGTSDQFRYAYRSLTGDGSIVARVATVQDVAVWVKAGVMIRETLDPSSAHGFMLVSSQKGVAFQRRPSAGGASVHTGGTTSHAPRWVKLTRTGNLFSAYESADGASWTLVGTETIAMAPTVYVGLAVTSHTTSSAAVCTFDSVTIQ